MQLAIPEVLERRMKNCYHAILHPLLQKFVECQSCPEYVDFHNSSIQASNAVVPVSCHLDPNLFLDVPYLQFQTFLGQNCCALGYLKLRSKSISLGLLLFGMSARRSSKCFATHKNG